MEDKPEEKHKITIIAANNELITSKQSSKQLKKEKKKKKKKLTSITKRHPEFELTYDMMLGIRYAVSLSEPSVTTTTTTRTKTKPIIGNIGYNVRTAYGSSTTRTSTSNKPIIGSGFEDSVEDSIDSSSDDELDNTELESEFLEIKKYKFPSIGSDTTPAHQMSDFKFKDYNPSIFRQLREWFRISTEEYLITICGDFKLLEFISNSKSGQFFFFSHNSQFIIKTMTRTESIFLRKILPSYYRYVSQQPDTLLPKFYGMHRVKRKKQKIYFLIQQNVFFSDVDDIHDQYDIKGSTQGRRATKAEKKKGAILKDLDWIDENKKIQIGTARAKLFKDQLKRDTHWLRGEKIMDYSLLVGIHYRNRNTSVPPNLNIKQMVLDHSYNETNENKFEPELQTVEEDKEDEDENKQEQKESKKQELLVIQPSTTEHTGTDEEDSDDEYIPNRRNSAPDNTNDNNSQTNNKHIKSQSLHNTEFNTNLKPMYRGHISVKHPKNYKRKTAAEMQFAVDEIQIPKGIDNENIDNNIQIEMEMKEQIHIEIEKANENEIKEQIIIDNHINHINNDTDNTNTNSADICPWTTYHGGMVYEDNKNNYVGNEVYFVGLIDILQKYNKRKKLENWIKKMKYDKNAISAAPPDLYAQRLCDFFDDKVI